MTGKELRELARTVLAEQLRADRVEPERVHAAVQALGVPMDPDEEREAQRKHVEELNAKAPIGTDRAQTNMAGVFGKQFGS